MDKAVKQVSCFRWPIRIFIQFAERNNRATKYSDLVVLPEDPTVKFVFSFFPGFDAADDEFGVILKENKNGKPVKVKLRFWAENDHGIRFGPVESTHQFVNIDEKCSFNIPIGKFVPECHRRLGLTFCCKIDYVGAILNAHTLFRQRLWTEYQEGHESGVTIKVDKRKFKVCRDVLICQSQVFKSMLQKIYTEGESGEIEIKDFEVGVIENFVKWLYLGEIDSEEEAVKLYYLGDKYLIQDLKDQCVKMMVANLSEVNLVQRLIWSIENSAKNLQNAVLDFLAADKEKGCLILLKSSEWAKYRVENNATAESVILELQEKMRPQPAQEVERPPRLDPYASDDEDEDDIQAPEY
ncbi:BTB domain-containing protein [Aphelenchoides bicaudatus]|nr:BTB domain-containing protein [Aphelenchoides bicaudatus]